MKSEFEFLPSYNSYIDYIYGWLLKFFSKKEILSEEQFKRIKEIERSAYPEQMTMFCNQSDLHEFLESINCNNIAQIDYILENGYYLLCLRHYNCVEILDFASETKKCNYIFKVVKFFTQNYSSKDIFMMSRESTSYQILKKFEEHGKIKFCCDYPKKKMGEMWHFIKMRINT